MVVSVWLTAGLITSRASLGYTPEHQQQRDKRCDDDDLARHQVTQRSLPSLTGPVIIRWYIHRM